MCEAVRVFESRAFMGVRRKFNRKSFPGYEQFADMHRGYTSVQGDFYGTVQEETNMLINV